MKKSKKELQFELDRALASNVSLTDCVSYERNNCSVIQNKHMKLEAEFAKLQDQVRRLLSDNKNLKQVIQNLGDCIAHL